MPLFGLVARRPAPWQGRDPAAKRFGYLPFESRVAECPATMRRSAQLLDKCVIERGAKQRPVSRLPIGGRLGNPPINLMIRNKGVAPGLFNAID